MTNPARILITGYTGFVGNYLVDACRKRYPQAALFGMGGRTGHVAPHERTDLQLLIADMTRHEEVQQVVDQARPDLVFHLAAQSSVAFSWQHPLETLKVNAEGTVHLLETLRTIQPTPRVVLIGSGEQYGMIQPEDNPIREECPFRPANPYAVSKCAQDLYGYQYFAAYHLPVVRARPFNHFGPRQSSTFVIANFARQIALIEAGKAQPVLRVGNLQGQRDFLPVEDVVDAYLALADLGQPGEAYNIGSGQPRSIQSILDLLLTLTNVRVDIAIDPALVRPVDIPLLAADASLLRVHTGWLPAVPFEVALQRTLEYWRDVVAAEEAS